MSALAWLLSETIMQARFGTATDLYDLWRKHTLAGTKIPKPLDEVIASFIEPVFGTPGAPKNLDHVHGHIGEWLWYLLTKDNPAVRVQPEPKGDVTGGGSDGFSIYEISTGELRFRLWESKKNTGASSLSSSLNTAYKQLDSQGLRYVAMIVGTFKQTSADTSQEVLSLVNSLPASWVKSDQTIGVGVVLTTHQPLPVLPFQKMSNTLSSFDKPGQLRGLASSINCYVELADMVREYLWTAL
ncbi:hypothetical protein NYP18_14245 [Corynebacterium sp. YIM 101645]|uniref:Restriction endonuclease n=1 Tax=Corynebacterium lemuris TaxID=1859292 RepID=A0ABT2FZY8_9CORY|nr:hypothetical protein [Corynebacterium lemuris]MCS5480803.1 hypothetical protein [Corynebacterium lemuris]